MNEVSDGNIEPGNCKGESLIDVQDKPTREQGSNLAFHEYLSPKVQETSSLITTVNGTVTFSLLDSPLPARNLRSQYTTRSRLNHSKQEQGPETNMAKEVSKKWNEKQTSSDNISSPKDTKEKNTTLLQPVQVKHTFITRFQLKLKIHPTNAHCNFIKFFITIQQIMEKLIMIEEYIQILPWWNNNNCDPVILDTLSANISALQIYFFV